MNAAARPSVFRLHLVLPALVCVAALGVHLAMIDLKGISTDEGIRLGIINGGHSFVSMPQAPWATYDEVLRTLRPYAYQPAYYLLQNTLMRLAERQDLLLFRLVNVALLACCLHGLLVLSRSWATWPRTFLIGLFAFNAYLIMHVLQIREYIAGVAFYIWSTWLVLRLDRRELAHEWPDIGWFLGYGLLLTLGFYLQTWTTFPAIGQGIFLVFRRRPQLGRFLGHLALSYMIVFTLTWPYLRNNPQKINVGLWERATVTLPGQLSNGFHLVLSGHQVGHGWFPSLLAAAWIALLVAGGWLFWRLRPRLRPAFVAEISRQAWLMLACMAVSLAFQIAYFFKVEPLSVWPRYFVIHYFFLVWLIALASRTLAEVCAEPPRRPSSLGALAGASALLAASAVYQVRSYWRDPYFDTSMSAASDWRTIGRAFSAQLRPHDLVFAHDFIARSTLSASQPPLRPMLELSDLEHVSLGEAPRLVYLESLALLPERAELARRMAARGYPRLEVLAVPAGDGSGPVPDWHILTFSRR